MNSRKHHKHHQKKKKLGLFYGSVASVILISLIAIFYFAVLVSAKPRSILLVTQKIESSLQKKFGEENVSIDQSLVSFTNYGTLKVSISGLRILYPTTEAGGKKSFIIPLLETEFRLFDFLLLRFQPSKIRVSNPNIFLGDWQKIIEPNQENIETGSDLSIIAGLFSSIRKGNNSIENLEVENAKLMIRSENFQRDFLLKKSQIQITNHNKNLTITTKNQLNIDEDEADINLSSNCKISDNIVCDLSLQNLSPDSIAELHPSLQALGNINAALSANVSFAFQDDKFSDLKFKVFAASGNFDFPEFFAKKMNFSDFAINGEYDHGAKILKLSEINGDFVDDKNPQNKPHIKMSLIVSSLENSDQKLDFNIELEKVLTDEIERFWPITLNQNDIRKWVSLHTSEGLIDKASAQFSLVRKNQEFELSDINADISFSGLNLKYDEEFPQIKNISANANFTYKGMKIAILGGEVLQSKITEGSVIIDDFDAKNVLLKISGKSVGHAANGLQHANNHPDFTLEVAKYLNGDSQNNFEITIPLSEEVTLKKSYIAVNSKITNLNNEYLRGDLSVTSKKNFNSVDFITNFDLSATEFDAHPFSMSKKSGIESKLNFAVSIKNPKNIEIKNLLLTKKEPQKPIEKFSGNIAFTTSPSFLVSSANFKNNNFNGANYSLDYQATNSSQKIIVNGNRINFGPFLSSNSQSTKSAPNLTIQIAANRADLLNNKYLRGFYFSLQCSNKLCSRGVLKSNYGKQDSINLQIDNSSKNNQININGRIENVGYLAEGFDISNVVVGGDASLKIEHLVSENKPIFKGVLTIDNDIVIYENETVKRFGKDTLFSQIRDKIFSSDKTTFDSVKVEFHVQDSVLDIRSLVANNYKIGITAKGLINLDTKDIHLKGMIIPGYIVNSLFGLGKIPVVGGVISGLLTGGEGGGLFGIRYQYDKNPQDIEGTFSTNKVTAFVPSTIQNLFE